MIRLDIRPAPADEVRNEALFFRLVREAFGQRRKTAVNAVAAGLGVEKRRLTALFAALDIPEAQRAERFTLSQFAALANALEADAAGYNENDG